MNKMLPSEINKIRDIILKVVDASKIFLFGSYARGSQTSESDYDFFVVIPNNSIRPLLAVQRIYCVLARENISVPVDILASYEKDFEENEKILPTIEHTIKSEGILLYEWMIKDHE